jgi:hypothetical protein
VRGSTNSHPDPRGSAAHAAHDAAEQAADNLPESFGNSDRRLAATRQHRGLKAPLWLLRLPGERSPNRRHGACLTCGLAEDVGEQVVVALRHLPFDDDLVLDVNVASGQEALVTASIDQCRRAVLERRGGRQSAFLEHVVDVLRRDPGFYGSVADVARPKP